MVSLNGDISENEGTETVHPWAEKNRIVLTRLATEADGIKKRQLRILSVPDGRVTPVEFSGDCFDGWGGGSWSSRDDLVFCGHAHREDSYYSLIIVGPDGKRARAFGDRGRGGAIMASR